MKKLPVGIESFKELMSWDYYYVDKTLFIKELLDDRNKVSLFTRPRRFGKTLAISMLRTFFEDERDLEGKKTDNWALFEGTKILSAGEMYLQHMGQYPVISLSLKSAKQPDYEMSYACLKEEIQNEFDRHLYVIEGASLQPKEKKKYQEICDGKADAAAYMCRSFFVDFQVKSKYNAYITNSNIKGSTNGPYHTRPAALAQQNYLPVTRTYQQRNGPDVQQQYGQHTGGDQEAIESRLYQL